jgi:hypothetical protein
LDFAEERTMRFRMMTLILLLWATPTLAANELTNGDFDTDVSGWGTFEPVFFVWDSLDVDTDPGSGSLKLTTSPSPENSSYIGAVSECVAVSPGELRSIAAWAYVPSGQLQGVEASVELESFDSPGCHPLDSLGLEQGPITNAIDEWVELPFDALIPGNGVSAHVRIAARRTGGGVLMASIVHFDAVFLPEPTTGASLLAGSVLLTALGGGSRRKARREHRRGGISSPVFRTTDTRHSVK